MSTARGWCITINNWTPEDLAALKAEKHDYMVLAPEVGESGTPHIQAYIYKHSKIGFPGLHKRLKRARLAEAIGTPEQNRTYIVGPYTDGEKHKPFNPDAEEFGQIPRQGKRTDLDEIRAVLKETNSMRKVVEIASSYQSVKMAEQILKYTEKPRNFKPEVLWFYGPTGSGKSRLAYELLGEDCYTCLSTGRWFDGYDAHENVLIDDMRKDFMKFHELLRLLDRYAMRIETKGGTRQFLAKRIIITSAYPPQEMYNTREDVQQLLRRIDQVRLFE
nr:MAG: replication associated protein [Cressdnaviricota sp.]